jgi:hypothetical protein
MAKLMEINSCRECESNKCNGLIPMCHLPKEGIHKDCPLQDVVIINNDQQIPCSVIQFLKEATNLKPNDIDKIIIVRKKG